MKFSEISREEWDELRPYLDTCLLPVTGMSGAEKPFEATECLEKLRDVLDLVEIPFKGRVVTYPAWHYAIGQPAFSMELDRWCSSLKAAGFRFIVIVAANPDITLACKAADLQIMPRLDGSLPTTDEVSAQIRALWNG